MVVLKELGESVGELRVNVLRQMRRADMRGASVRHGNVMSNKMDYMCRDRRVKGRRRV
jgi:hypothetical protein